VDGGSSDRTREEARAHCAVVIEAPMGRARQMNVGAQYASGEYLIFLHADTLLPENWAESVRQALKKTEVLGGAFSLRIDGHFFGLRIVEALANLRSHRFSMPYGDQAIFVRAMDFRELGGFPDIPIMEDFEFMRRLGRRGRVHILTERVVTSCRRWKTLGILRTTAINQAVILGYYLGVSPARLARFYRRS
jgi:rSAM/selenodomain-associated transferase 2